MAFLKKDGDNLLSLSFVDGSNNVVVNRSDDIQNFTLGFSHLHHHHHHE
ncbi:MAG: hypothetical protein ACFE96_00630 [Candidatus Hermodarchaeota archaeon]